MRALDTNVLVRFLVRDDPGQYERAHAAIADAQARGEPLFVGDLVLAETVWVLTRRYRVPKAEVVDVLARLVASRDLVFASRERLLGAIARYRAGAADFADYLIAAHAAAAGADTVLTFDQALRAESDFREP